MPEARLKRSMRHFRSQISFTIPNPLVGSTIVHMYILYLSRPSLRCTVNYEVYMVYGLV